MREEEIGGKEEEERSKAGESGKVEERSKAGESGKVEERSKAGESGKVEERSKAGESGKVEERSNVGKSRGNMRYEDPRLQNVTKVDEDIDKSEVFICDAKPKVKLFGAPLSSKQILSQFVSGDRSLYTHLMLLLEEIVSSRPDDLIDYFDQYSFVRRRGKVDEDGAMNVIEPATRLTSLFYAVMPHAKDPGMLGEEMEEERIMGEDMGDNRLPSLKSIMDIVEFIDQFEDMGVGLPKDEAFQISIALRKLAKKHFIRKIRFWGKIFGLERNYIVAECEITHDEQAVRRLQALADWADHEGELLEEKDLLVKPSPIMMPTMFRRSTIQPIPILGEDEMLGEGAQLPWEEDPKRIRYPKLYSYQPPPIPKADETPPVKTKKENPGEGANKKFYFVCNEPGEEWQELPEVTPEQIVMARKVKKYFHGYLLQDLDSYPPFPGKEREYLRAQIARISAGTQISPLGFYQFGGGEAAEAYDEEGDDDSIVPNIDFEPIPYQDLLDTEFWVHHTAHILAQGRTVWWDPKMEEGQEEMTEEEENEKDKEKPEEMQPEVGPPMLTPLSEDVALESAQPWTIKGTSQLLPGSGVVGVRSNLWPGAFAFAKERTFENVYLGWGLKHQISGFTPQPLPPYGTEYELGPEIMEIEDPSPELEREWWEAHRPKVLPPMVLGEGEEGEYGGSPIYTEPSEDEDDT